MVSLLALAAWLVGNTLPPALGSAVQHLAPRSRVAENAAAAQKIAALSSAHKKIFRALRMADVPKNVPHPYYFPLGDFVIRATLAGQPDPQDGLGEPIYQQEFMGEVFSYFPHKEWNLIRGFLVAREIKEKLLEEVPAVHFLNPRYQPVDLAEHRMRLQQRLLMKAIHAPDRSPWDAHTRIIWLSDLLRERPEREIAKAAYARLAGYAHAMADRQMHARMRYVETGEVPAGFEPDGVVFLGITALLRLKELERKGIVPESGTDYADDRLIIHDQVLRTKLSLLQDSDNFELLRNAYEHIEWEGSRAMAPRARSDLGRLEHEIADPLTKILYWKIDGPAAVYMARQAGPAGWAMLQERYGPYLAQLELCAWTGSGISGLGEHTAIRTEPLLMAITTNVLLEIIHRSFTQWKARPSEQILETLRQSFGMLPRLFVSQEGMIRRVNAIAEIAEAAAAHDVNVAELLLQMKRDAKFSTNEKNVDLIKDVTEEMIQKMYPVFSPQCTVLFLQDPDTAVTMLKRVLRNPRSFEINGIRAGLMRRDFSQDLRLKLVTVLRHSVSDRNIMFIQQALNILAADPSERVKKAARETRDMLPVMRWLGDVLGNISTYEAQVGYIDRYSRLYWELMDIFAEELERGRSPRVVERRLRSWLRRTSIPGVRPGRKFEAEYEVLDELYTNALIRLHSEQKKAAEAATPAGFIPRLVRSEKSL